VFEGDICCQHISQDPSHTVTPKMKLTHTMFSQDMVDYCLWITIRESPIGGGALLLVGKRFYTSSSNSGSSSGSSGSVRTFTSPM